MIVQMILFFGLALVAVASAIGLLVSKSAIYAALNLIINFVTVAIFYVLLDAPFIALTQISVYGGAIMVLFLFVIMLLGAEQLGTKETLGWQRPVAVLLAVLLFGLGAYVVATRLGLLPAAAPVDNNFGAPIAIGTTLFGAYLLPFEVISVLLLVAMVGAIILTRKGK
jgi:NADH-quinone oxidoreductase subunit J